MLGRRERWLAVAAIRFLRTCLAMKDEFYNRYVVSLPACRRSWPACTAASLRGRLTVPPNEHRQPSFGVSINSCPRPTLGQVCSRPVRPSFQGSFGTLKLPARSLSTQGTHCQTDCRCGKG